MINSGSFANLLSLKCLTNPFRKNYLKPGDECLIPALGWSTSFWPVVQCQLTPKFVDVNIDNFTMDLDVIKKNYTKKTKAIMLVNVLGNTSDLDKIKKFAKKKKLFLIVDNCESLGSKYKNKYLGTFGELGTFSFYPSHQISAGEGVMILTNSLSDCNILKSLRSHGMDRDFNIKNKKKGILIKKISINEIINAK